MRRKVTIAAAALAAMGIVSIAAGCRANRPSVIVIPSGTIVTATPGVNQVVGIELYPAQPGTLHVTLSITSGKGYILMYANEFQGGNWHGATPVQFHAGSSAYRVTPGVVYTFQFVSTKGTSTGVAYAYVR